MELGVKNLIVTLGKDGSVAVTPNERIKVDAMRVVSVDIVAAGDTYVGYLAASLMSGKTLQQAMNCASKASAITITRKGSIVSIPFGVELL